jgi:hypothetical protein
MVAARLRPYWPLALILIGTAILQTVLLVRLPTISADGIIFTRVARELAADPLATMQREDQHPGYPGAMLGATRALQAIGYDREPEAWMAGGIAVSFIAGLFTVAVVWLFAREMFDTTIASIAAIGYAALPVPRAIAVDAQSDSLHGLFYLFAAWMASTGLASGSVRRLALAGLSSGLAFWVRPEGLEVAMIASGYVLLLAVFSWPWRKSVLALGAVAGISLVVASPYMLLAGKITSKQLLVFKEKPAPSYIERLAEAEEAVAVPPGAPVVPPAITPAPIAQAPVQPAPAQPVVAAPPADTAVATPVVPPAGGSVARVKPAAAADTDDPNGDPDYSPELVSTLIGLGFAAFINSICQGLKFVFIPYYLLGDIALVWRRPAGIQVAFLATLGITHILILVSVYVFSGYIAHRHTIPLVGLAMPFAALGIWQASVVVGRWVRLRPMWLAVPTLVTCCLVVLPFTLRRLNAEFIPVIQAAEWVEQRIDPGAGIVCNSPYVPYYSGRPVAELVPLSPTLGEALLKAPDARYDYAVVHVNAHDYRPEWLEQLAPYYQQVLEIDDPLPFHRPRKVLVFQVRDQPIRNAALPGR